MGKYRLVISQYDESTGSVVYDELLNDVDSSGAYDDTDSIKKAKQAIYDNYYYLCKLVTKWWVETDDFSFNDELWIDIYEIDENDDYEWVDGVCIYQDKQFDI